MAFTILAFDGFDWYTYTYQPGVRPALWGMPAINFVAGRFGGVAVNLGNALQTNALPITDTIALHWAIKPYSSPAIQIKDSANAVQFEIVKNPVSNLLELKRGSTVVATGSKPLADGNWYSIQTHFYLHDVSGRCVVKIEGETDLNFTGDTKNSALSNISFVQFTGGSGNHLDDVVFYLPDVLNVDWLNDCKVTTKLPSGVGASTNWVVTGAPTNHQAAASTDGDTSYVASSTPGDIDLYAMSAATPLGQVYAVNVGLLTRKDDAATRQVRALVRIGGINYNGPTQTLTSSYLSDPYKMQTSPATGAAWGLAEVDSIQAGVEMIA